MPKTKSSPALFEVLGDDVHEDSAGHLRVPAWWAQGTPPSPPPQSDGAHEVEQSLPRPPRIAPFERPPAVVNDPIVAIDGDRLKISLTSVSAAVAVFGAMVLVLGAHEWGSRSGVRSGFEAGFAQGRASYEAQTTDEIALARSKPAATELVSSLLVGAETLPLGPTTESAQAGAGPWIRDYTYVVAQEFAAERASDAEQAEAFLAQHGIETQQVVRSGGSIQLITTQGFNHRDAAQKKMGRQLLAKVHEVGGRYYATGGGYRLQGYFKTLKGERW